MLDILTLLTAIADFILTVAFKRCYTVGKFTDEYRMLLSSEVNICWERGFDSRRGYQTTVLHPKNNLNNLETAYSEMI